MQGEYCYMLGFLGNMTSALWSRETSNELVSCVREPEEVGRVRSAIDCN
jgi:hypothetical protein